MSKINTNVTSLIAQRVLKTNNNSLNTSLERLSTGLKINKGADNPAGLIASEILRGEKKGIQTAIENAGRASNVIGTAEGGLTEVSSLLTELQGLVSQSANTAGLSPEEKAANQLQVDSILGTINRVASNTAFEGQKLLNGSFDYTTSSTAASAFGSIQVNSAQLAGGVTQSVTVAVTNSATQGKLTFTGAGLGTTGTTLEIAGRNGTQQVSFAGSATNANIADAINAISSVTGVTASAATGSLLFKATDFGSENYVSVRSVAGAAFAVTGGTSGKALGTDAAVTVNGATATVKGLDVTYRSATLDVEFQITANGYGGGDHRAAQQRAGQDVRHHRRRGGFQPRLQGRRERQGQPRHQVRLDVRAGQQRRRVPQLAGRRREQQPDLGRPGRGAEDHRRVGQAGDAASRAARIVPEVHDRVDRQLAGHRLRERVGGRERDPRHRLRRRNGVADPKPDSGPGVDDGLVAGQRVPSERPQPLAITVRSGFGRLIAGRGRTQRDVVAARVSRTASNDPPGATPAGSFERPYLKMVRD